MPLPLERKFIFLSVFYFLSSPYLFYIDYILFAIYEKFEKERRKSFIKFQQTSSMSIFILSGHWAEIMP